MTQQPPAGARVVWSGRFLGDVPDGADGLDGWSTDDAALAAALDGAVELLVLDPLSFPWKVLQGRRELPLTVRLPEELSVDDLDGLLGRPLLRHVTRHDRLVLADADQRAALAARHDLADDVWLAPDADADEAAPSDQRLRAKRVELQVVTEVAGELDRALTDPAESVVEVHGAGAPVTALRRASRGVVQRHGAPTDDLFVPSPHCAVVWLTDGGQPAAERTELLRTAVARLGAGRRLVVVGYVAPRPGGPANPSVRQLVEELDEVAFGALHVDEVRSLRLGDEPWARAVLLGAMRLGPEVAR